MATNKIYIPTFISSVTYAPARVLPHVYFYNGKKASETYYIQGYSNGNTGSVISNPVDAFPYFDNYEGQDPQSGSRSLLFFNEPAVYGTTPTNSLYNDYWETYVNLLYNPRTRLVNCEAIIPLADYFKMELNDICEWRGNYYHLRAINSYNLSNGECQLQLLGPLYPPVISGILPELQCNFDFTSSVIVTTSTTSTTTAAPTTTTTLAPTTTTTTIQPYCTCQTVRFTNNHTRLAAGLRYTPCGTTEEIQYFVGPRSTFTVCLANPPGFAYPGGTDFFYTILGTCTVPGCAGITTTTTSAPTTTTTTAAPTTTTSTTTTTTSTTTTTTTAAPTTTTTTTAAPTTTTTSTTSTTTAGPIPPLQKYRYSGNTSPSSTRGTFVDFYGDTRGIEAYTFGTSYDFIALSGSVNVTGGTVTVLQASASFPSFNTVTVTKTSSNGLTAYTGQIESGELVFISESPGGYTRTYCWVSGSASETYDPLNKLTITTGGTCAATTTTSTSTTAAPTTTSTTTAGPTTTTTTISSSCKTYEVTNSSPSLGGQVSYVPCGASGYRDIFVPQSSTITLCVEDTQIVNVSGYASSSLTDLGTSCVATLTDCLSYTISNSAGVSRDYSGKACSNCATSLYNINAGQTVVRCFVSGTFSTSYPANVTAVAGANCNVSGSGCPS